VFCVPSLFKTPLADAGKRGAVEGELRPELRHARTVAGEIGGGRVRGLLTHGMFGLNNRIIEWLQDPEIDRS